MNLYIYIYLYIYIQYIILCLICTAKEIPKTTSFEIQIHQKADEGYGGRKKRCPPSTASPQLMSRPLFVVCVCDIVAMETPPFGSAEMLVRRVSASAPGRRGRAHSCRHVGEVAVPPTPTSHQHTHSHTHTHTHRLPAAKCVCVWFRLYVIERLSAPGLSHRITILLPCLNNPGEPSSDGGPSSDNQRPARQLQRVAGWDAVICPITFAVLPHGHFSPVSERSDTWTGPFGVYLPSTLFRTPPKRIHPRP